MPGTYHVVVNPLSFADYEDYRPAHDESNPVQFPLSNSSGNARIEQSSIDHTHPQGKHLEKIQDASNDKDVVVLKVFEDETQRGSAPGELITRQDRSSRTSTLSTSLSISATSKQTKNHLELMYKNTPLMRMVPRSGNDHQVVRYYKSFVLRHLAQVHRDSLGTSLETGALSAPDVFEMHAAKFLPVSGSHRVKDENCILSKRFPTLTVLSSQLYHALMAFSALSMSYKTGSPNFDALQHYQEAFPCLQASLHGEEDLASDGVFLTHFMLLLYEIAAGEDRGLSLWSEHISQLLRIVLLRRDRNGHEPYGFIVWWVANIDVHALLSGMGNGEFVETMLRRNLLPSGLKGDKNHRHHSGDTSTLTKYEALPSALAFHRRISTLAAELGLMARDMRAEELRNPHDRSPATIRGRQDRIGKLQDTLRRTWNAQMPASVAKGYCNQVLPVGARGIFEHVSHPHSHSFLPPLSFSHNPTNPPQSFALYRALLIYSHTSMYPSQRPLHPPRHTPEISQSADEIVRLAREIVRHGHLERKFIVFPLFMAGSVSHTPRQREEILALVERMEQDSVGRNMVAARVLLGICFERQGRGGGAGAGGVDWVGVIAELGLRVVNCRL